MFGGNLLQRRQPQLSEASAPREVRLPDSVQRLPQDSGVLAPHNPQPQRLVKPPVSAVLEPTRGHLLPQQVLEDLEVLLNQQLEGEDSASAGPGRSVWGRGYWGVWGFGNQTQPQQQQQQQQGFGGGGLFGGSTMGGGGGFAAQSQAPTLSDKFLEMRSFWDPTSPNCQFKHYFYNMVHPSEVQYYRCPPNEDPTLYQQAVQDNPDPSCMVPVLAVGFADIKKRIQQQDVVGEAHKAKLRELAAQLEKIERKHYLETTAKLEEYKRQHATLSHAFYMYIMRFVEMLKNKSYPIRAEEEALRSRLEAMDMQLKKPAHFRGRIQELQATVRSLKDSRRLGTDGKDGESRAVAYEIGSEEQMRLIGETLQNSQEGLHKLTELIAEDTKHLKVMENGYKETFYQRR
ncbi:nucleoporin complex subunit 54-domain-containing protein [Chytridium lagenaria]|nr:nucleoporin complex subunit 54-domain-containing protein [Chytridium lagenaria]